MSDEEREVLFAAEERAEALAACDTEALWRIHHPDMQWMPHIGDVLDRERYIHGNTSGELLWSARA